VSDSVAGIRVAHARCDACPYIVVLVRLQNAGEAVCARCGGRLRVIGAEPAERSAARGLEP